ncbi:hypothetical protein WN48_09845 [Eufriesea mexicana]|uniref:Uncharacterized protein n=1 Tax=Eufriesea mexicana TaxID=516756 RepID=A0A310SE38_9HYME|nr:hypothetical protein WN48_09845 [Eufriesea mexicana]
MWVTFATGECQRLKVRKREACTRGWKKWAESEGRERERAGRNGKKAGRGDLERRRNEDVEGVETGTVGPREDRSECIEILASAGLVKRVLERSKAKRPKGRVLLGQYPLRSLLLAGRSSDELNREKFDREQTRCGLNSFDRISIKDLPCESRREQNDKLRSAISWKIV